MKHKIKQILPALLVVAGLGISGCATKQYPIEILEYDPEYTLADKSKIACDVVMGKYKVGPDFDGDKRYYVANKSEDIVMASCIIEGGVKSFGITIRNEVFDSFKTYQDVGLDGNVDFIYNNYKWDPQNPYTTVHPIEDWSPLSLVNANWKYELLIDKFLGIRD
jgi:hypothetical protein